MAARGRFWIGGPAARAGWRLLQFLHRIGRFFFHGVRVNWKQKHLSDWFVFEITFLLWRWRHKIQNTHAINFQTRASLVRDFCCSKVKKKKKSPREKKFQFFSILVFPTTKTLMKWTTHTALLISNCVSDGFLFTNVSICLCFILVHCGNQP